MENELPFDGFKELIQYPLEKSDPQSFELIKSIFLDVAHAKTDPFRLLVQRFSNKVYRGREAKEHWRHILSHKREIEAKLGRRVGIHAASIDYFDAFADAARRPLASPNNTRKETDQAHGNINLEESIAKVYSPNYHLENLKKEMLRAKRYKHSLSAIMLDIDEFKKINELFSFKTGDEVLTLIVKIIQKTIRAVDILTRYSGDRFLIILPNTNKRESFELAERLRQNVSERTKRIHGLDSGVTVTLSVGQTTGAGSSTDFMKQLENILAEGKKKERNKVYAL
jgi:diguanylate cyclase (GGDEF)-like protein